MNPDKFRDFDYKNFDIIKFKNINSDDYDKGFNKIKHNVENFSFPNKFELDNQLKDLKGNYAEFLREDDNKKIRAYGKGFDSDQYLQKDISKQEYRAPGPQERGYPPLSPQNPNFNKLPPNNPLIPRLNQNPNNYNARQNNPPAPQQNQNLYRNPEPPRYEDQNFDYRKPIYEDRPRPSPQQNYRAEESFDYEKYRPQLYAHYSVNEPMKPALPPRPPTSKEASHIETKYFIKNLKNNKDTFIFDYKNMVSVNNSDGKGAISFIPDNTFTLIDFVNNRGADDFMTPFLMASPIEHYQFEQGPELIDEIKVQPDQYKTLNNFEKRFGGLCEIICNRVLIDDLLGAKSKNPNFLKENICLSKMNQKEVKDSHIIDVYSNMAKFKALFFKKYEDNFFSSKIQSKLISETKDKKKNLNRDLIRPQLENIEVGAYIKIEVIQSSFMTLAGHSLLIKKTGIDGSGKSVYSFFDPNQGEFVNLSLDKVCDHLDLQLNQWDAKDIVFLDGKKYLKKLEKINPKT